MIELKNISIQYQGKQILDNICTQIPKGKITAFVGANGAGKSTLLNIIARLTKQNNGEILIDDKNINQFSINALAKKISILKQSNYFNISLKVKELVEFGRYPHSFGHLKKEDHHFVSKALSLMDMLHLQDKFLNQLSGGERQRAFIAMTIAQNTDYILLDEPLNNLDMKHCTQIMSMLKNLVKKENKTILIVLHDINYAAIYADYILAIKSNKLYLNAEKSIVINQAILKDIFEMNLDLIEHNNQKFINYYHF